MNSGFKHMNTRARFYVSHLLPALLVTTATVALDFTSLDIKITGWFYDTATSTFPWGKVFSRIRRHQCARGVHGFFLGEAPEALQTIVSIRSAGFNTCANRSSYDEVLQPKALSMGYRYVWWIRTLY